MDLYAQAYSCLYVTRELVAVYCSDAKVAS